VSHLHLVTDDKPTSPRRPGRSGSLSLTREEAQHLRASIRNLARVRYGTLRKLGAALGVHPNVLTRSRHQSAALAVAVWRLTGIPVEVLLTGKLAVVPATLDAPDPPRLA